MVREIGGVEPEAVRQSARHTLHVEGNASSIDLEAQRFFLRRNGIDIRVAPLGSSSNIRAAAHALYQSSHDYYFLIDRDHHSDEYVKSCWDNFPDEGTHNLLMWYRREIENYFLIPEYLARSEYRICPPEKLQQCIRETASQRVFLDIANMVILQLKAELKQNWIEPFKDTGTTGFGGKETALAKLMEKHEAAKQACDVLEQLQKYPISDRFHETLNKFFDGQEELELGRGLWLEMIRGKHVLPVVIDKCFRVPDATGRYLQGNERCIEVVKSLLRLPLEAQPDDFKELHKLISARVTKRI